MPTSTNRKSIRTSLGLLTYGVRGRGGALTLTIAAGRDRGTHTDSPIDARDAADLHRELSSLCEELMDAHHLSSIEVYAPDRHGGHQIEMIEGDMGSGK